MNCNPAPSTSRSPQFGQQTGRSRHPTRNRKAGSQSQRKGGKGHARHSVVPQVSIQPPSGSENECDNSHTGRGKSVTSYNTAQYHESLPLSEQSLRPKTDIGDLYTYGETVSDMEDAKPHRDMYWGHRPPTPPRPKRLRDRAVVKPAYRWVREDDQEETVYSQAALDRWSNQNPPSLNLPARREKQGFRRALEMETFMLESRAASRPG